MARDGARVWLCDGRSRLSRRLISPGVVPRMRLRRVGEKRSSLRLLLCVLSAPRRRRPTADGAPRGRRAVEGGSTHLLCSCCSGLSGLSRRVCCSRPRPIRSRSPMMNTAARCIQRCTSWRGSALPSACSKVLLWPRPSGGAQSLAPTSDPQHYPLQGLRPLVLAPRSRSRSSRRSCAALSSTNRSMSRA